MFSETVLFVFYNQNSEIALSRSKAALFYRDNLKDFKNFKKTDTVLNFNYSAIKLPNLKLVDEKLPESEPRVYHSFYIKIISRKKLLNVSAPPQAHFR